MISLKVNRLRLGAAVLALAVGGTTSVEAQQIRTVYSPSQFHLDANARLAQHVRSLANSPRSLSSLLGAGEAALELSDPQTALTFFARAEEVAPRDGRVKAGMGASFLLMEDVTTAMRFFGEATSLGLPPATFAKDRGLAYDLTGDPARAQADYRLALQRGDDPEIRQRLALSLAISGQKEEALAMVDPLVKRQHRGAWRTRAFILALTGDTEAAMLATQAVMPAQAASMKPFYDTLPWLNPAQQAMAVHFGHFPTGTELAQAMRDAPAREAQAKAAASTAAGQPDATQASLGRDKSNAKEARKKSSTRRRPSRSRSDEGDRVGPASRAYDRSMHTASAQPRQPRQPSTRVSSDGGKGEPEPSDPGPAQPEVVMTRPAAQQQAAVEPPVRQPVGPAIPEDGQSAFAGLSDRVGGLSVAGVAPTDPAPAQPQAPALAATELPPSTVSETAASKPAATAPAASPAKERPPVVRLPFGPPTPGTPPRLAAISETVTALPDIPAPELSKPEPEAPKAEKAKAKSAEKKKAAAPAKDKVESRHWVQLAGGADKAALPREFKRLKDKAPKLLIGKSAWTTPLRFTNRLLVGPFDSMREAQEFVNELGKLGVEAFSWTSPEGQEIVKLAAK